MSRTMPPTAGVGAPADPARSRRRATGGAAPLAGPVTVARLPWILSTLVTLGWCSFVTASGDWGRVVDHWEVALTMLFGSFLGGSSPVGSGAVAFPVLTKALAVPAPVARSFGLCIQSVGMTTASLSILACRRPVHRRALLVALPAAIAGFLISALLLGHPGQLFWPMVIGPPWVRATFTIIFATTAFLTLRPRLLDGDGPGRAAPWTGRLEAGLAVAAALGGMLSAMTGTGTNVMVFLFLVIVAGVQPHRAVTTAIIAMASVSICGFVVLGLAGGQLDVVVAAGRVTSSAGLPTDLPAHQGDLLGMWLAAVPVVVWGAPLGATVAARISERVLTVLIGTLAATEVVTTIVLVPAIRSDPVLLTYLVVGVVTVPRVWLHLRRHFRPGSAPVAPARGHAQPGSR